jgi:hypothetical protein
LSTILVNRLADVNMETANQKASVTVKRVQKEHG